MHNFKSCSNILRQLPRELRRSRSRPAHWLDRPAVDLTYHTAIDRLFHRALDKFPSVDEPAANDHSRNADTHDHIRDPDAEIIRRAFRRVTLWNVIADVCFRYDIHKSGRVSPLCRRTNNQVERSGSGRKKKKNLLSVSFPASRLPQTQGLPPATIVICRTRRLFRCRGVPFADHESYADPVPERTRIRFGKRPS